MSFPVVLPGRVFLKLAGRWVNFYGFNFLGTWKTAEAAEAAKYGMKPGDAKYQDINNDNAYTSADYQPIGNGTPKYSFGFINDITYKDFFIEFYVSGNTG